MPAAPAPAGNRNLEEARKRFASQQWSEALEELQTAEQLPGNSVRELADIAALRASALLSLPPSPERRQQAADALVQLFHLDPEGTALARATEAARALAQELRSQRALVLTDRLVSTRAGRPLRLRARVAGATLGVPQLTLAYAIEGDDDYVRVPMEPAGNAYEAWLRPGVGGFPRSGEHTLSYFIEATGPGGAVLDSNGTPDNPIRTRLADNVNEAAGIAALDEGGKPAHPPPAPPSRAWYRRWEIVGPIGGALVVGALIGVIAAQPKPQPGAGSLGRVDLP